MNFDANHRIIGVGYCVRAMVRAPPFDQFYALSPERLTLGHGSLSCLGVLLNFLYSRTSAATTSNAAMIFPPVEINEIMAA